MGSKLIHYYSKSHFINITRESTRPLLLGVTHCPALKISKLIHYYSKSHFINITRESTRPLQLGVTHCPALKISQFTHLKNITIHKLLLLSYYQISQLLITRPQQLGVTHCPAL